MVASWIKLVERSKESSTLPILDAARAARRARFPKPASRLCITVLGRVGRGGIGETVQPETRSISKHNSSSASQICLRRPRTYLSLPLPYPALGFRCIRFVLFEVGGSRSLQRDLANESAARKRVACGTRVGTMFSGDFSPRLWTTRLIHTRLVKREIKEKKRKKEKLTPKIIAGGPRR